MYGIHAFRSTFGKPASRRIAFLALIMVLALSAFLLARYFTLDMISYVVCQAFVQKSPPQLEPEKIREVFARSQRSADRDSGTRRVHLQRLFEISQRLEKIQRLTEKEALEMLAVLENAH